jgi:hypothetical protein
MISNKFHFVTYGLIWPVIDGYYLEKASITDDIHILQDDDK